MIGLALTLDYEVYGDGGGSLGELVVEPTDRFLDICDEYDVKTTLFVDVAEILAMKKLEIYEEDVYQSEEQIRFAHRNGHDVQLHIHPWWFDAKFENRKWQFENIRMSLADFEADEATRKILLCKKYLTELLTPTGIDYSCIAYRAGSWAMMPTENIFDALTTAGIKVDSSVYKWGKLDTDIVKYDYTEAYSNINPWFFSRKNVNEVMKDGQNNLKCLEIPIYTEKKRGIDFLTIKRIFLMRKVRSVVLDRSSQAEEKKKIKKLFEQFGFLFRGRPKKFDFCKCSFGEMEKMISNIVAKNPVNGYLPVVAIGHSKDFIYSRDLKKLLDLLKSRYSDLIELVSLKTAYNKYLMEYANPNEE